MCTRTRTLPDRLRCMVAKDVFELIKWPHSAVGTLLNESFGPLFFPRRSDNELLFTNLCCPALPPPSPLPSSPPAHASTRVSWSLYPSSWMESILEASVAPELLCIWSSSSSCTREWMHLHAMRACAQISICKICATRAQTNGYMPWCVCMNTYYATYCLHRVPFQVQILHQPSHIPVINQVTYLQLSFEWGAKELFGHGFWPKCPEPVPSLEPKQIRWQRRHLSWAETDTLTAAQIRWQLQPLIPNRFIRVIWHLGSSTAANWVSFDLNVSCSSCWGYSLINTLKLKKKVIKHMVVQWRELLNDVLVHTIDKENVNSSLQNRNHACQFRSPKLRQANKRLHSSWWSHAYKIHHHCTRLVSSNINAHSQPQLMLAECTRVCGLLYPWLCHKSISRGAWPIHTTWQDAYQTTTKETCAFCSSKEHWKRILDWNVHTHTQTCTNDRMNMHKHVNTHCRHIGISTTCARRIHICICIHMHIHIFVYYDIYVYIYICTSIYTYVYIYI